MGGKLVTLIAPCWNAERYIGRFLDSVLSQTYGNIQFILVNDGSTDGTDGIIHSYAGKLNDSLSEFRYIIKENGGPGSAVNEALKYTEGEYLSWADVDDVLLPDNIRKKAEFLDAHNECGLVACDCEFLDFETGRKISEPKFTGGGGGKLLFRDMLFGSGIPCYPGVFMIRTELLMRRLKDRSIYHLPDVGQNWQLLLPVAWDSKCGFIGECLYSYYVRGDSHSHSMDRLARIKQTFSGYDVVLHTMHFLDSSEKEKLDSELRGKYSETRFKIALNMLCEYYSEAVKCGKSPLKLLARAAVRLLKSAVKTVRGERHP